MEEGVSVGEALLCRGACVVEGHYSWAKLEMSADLGLVVGELTNN